MIKEFVCNKDGRPSMNWVDDNNRLVGFDYDNPCFGEFGYEYCKFDLEAEAEHFDNSGDCYDNPFKRVVVSEKPDLSKAFFSEEQPIADEGKFKIEGSHDCNWLVLYNYHNGYYSHGFVFKENGKEVCKGDL